MALVSRPLLVLFPSVIAFTLGACDNTGAGDGSAAATKADSPAIQPAPPIDPKEQALLKELENLKDPSMPPRLQHATGVPEYRLAGQVVNDDDILVFPKAILIVGNRLVVADSRVNPALHIMDVYPNGGSRRSIGRSGQGPGEFLSATTLSHAVDRDNAFWVHDYNANRITRLKFDTTQTGVSVASVVNFGGEHPERVISIGDTMFLGAIADTAYSAFGIFDAHGKLIRTAGNLRRDADSVPPYIAGDAYNPTFLCTVPGGRRLGLAFQRYGRLQIHDAARGSMIADADVPAPFTRRIDVFPGTQTKRLGGPNQRFGYGPCAGSERFIYALFSGKLRRAYGASPGPAETEFVHVFSWGGTFLGVLILDHPAVSIAVDPQDEHLYTGVAGINSMIRVSALNIPDIPFMRSFVRR